MNKKVIGYEILTSDNTLYLEREIISHLGEGWELCITPNIIQSTNSYSKKEYIQSFVLYEKNKEIFGNID